LPPSGLLLLDPALLKDKGLLADPVLLPNSARLIEKGGVLIEKGSLAVI
jgi:hypothetical protein